MNSRYLITSETVQIDETKPTLLVNLHTNDNGAISLFEALAHKGFVFFC